MDEQHPPGEADASRVQRSDPPSGEVRIAAPEAAVAAGMPDAPAPETEPEAGASDVTGVYELPDWAEPPTGQVPRVLLEDPITGEVAASEVMRGPTWRQDRADWGDADDLSFMVDEDEPEDRSIAGRVEPEAAPFSFSFEEIEGAAAGEELDSEAAWAPLADSGAEPELALHERRAHRRQPARHTRHAGEEHGRGGVAVATGVGLAGLVVIFLLAGPLPSLVFAAIALAITAGEAFSALQGAGYRPATIVGLLAVPGLVVAAYLHQGIGIAVVGAATFVAVASFHLWRPTDEPLTSMSTTLFVVAWVGLLGAFAGLLLAPAEFSGRHGLQILFAGVALTVAHDIGSYLAGSRFGRHRFAPSISPNKTLEGLLGGTVLALLVAGVGVAALHPFGVASALELGVVVSVLAPVGDLCESLVKRDLGVKDMGSLLPGHGGLFDRVDALLFVLPATYCFARVANLA